MSKPRWPGVPKWKPIRCVLGFHRWRRAADPGTQFTLYQCTRCKCGLVVENGLRPVGFGDLAVKE